MDLSLINQEIAAGYIGVREHPVLPLRILNYTPKTQYERRWNAATLACRGLILGHNDQVVARPFNKFFNYEEIVDLPSGPFKVYDKADGSMLIIAIYEGQKIFATRGSFTSEQAVKAKEIYEANYSHIELYSDYTYIFELIYPENRIVIDYGPLEDLIQLATIHTASGREAALVTGFTHVKAYDIHDLSLLLESTDSENREGFVVHYDSGERLKIKFAEYKRLHRLMTNLSDKSVLDLLSTGQTLIALYENVPDEFYKWLKATEAKLLALYKTFEGEALEEFRNTPASALTRKEKALYYVSCKHASILFSMLDGNEVTSQIWKLVAKELKDESCSII